MKSRLVFLTTIVLICFSVLSCKKELIKTNSKSELLSSETWKYQHYYLDFDKENTILAYFINKAINLKDLSKYRIKFSTEGSYVETNEDGNTTSGTWRFNADETVIEMQKSGVQTLRKIYVLDATGLQWGSIDGNMLAILIAS